MIIAHMDSVELTPIINRARQGDAEAIAALYRQYAPTIYRYIAYRVSTTADAEDLTAEVFLKMVEGIARYRVTGAPFEAWLYRIAAARIVDFRRRKSRRPQAALSDTLADTGPLPEERLHRQQEVDQLKAALQQLPDDYQTILLLRFVERKSHKEVAQIVGKSISAVKTTQYRALTRLADLLGSSDKVRHYLRGRHD